MEKLESESLPKIFRFSVLCNILPYYGYIDEWVKILKGLSTQTKIIWENNSEAFLYWGKEIKRELVINELREFRYNKSMNELLKLCLHRNQVSCTSKYSKRYFSLKEAAAKSIYSLIQNLKQNEWVVFDSHKDDSSLSQIYFWKENEILNIIKAVKCPFYKPKTKIFSRNSTNWPYYIFDQSRDFSIAIIWKGKTVEVQTVLSQIYWITQRKAKIVNSFNKYCSLEKCVCKPKILWIDLKTELFDAFEELLSFEYYSSLNQINIKSRLIDIHWMHLIFFISRKYPQIEINFNFNYHHKSSWGISFYYNEKLMRLIFSGKECTLERKEGYKNKYFGQLVGFIDWFDSNFVILKLFSIYNLRVNLKSNENNEEINQTLISVLKESSKLNDDVFMIVEKNKIVPTIRLTDYINLLPYFKYCKAIQIDLSSIESDRI